MAVPATFLNIYLLSFCIVSLFNTGDYKWTFINALLFSSVMSVLDYMGDQNISKKINYLQQGEVLTSTTFAVILYTIFTVSL
jgi:hypothetical protein